ncbi:hypothetical protein [Erwinia sp. 9145]|uniref:hypothetical protein n=1 Tax=Erwinia sp. 9145 TaxID=1500895 RepID=UPI000554065D|nr:hypothetical protein [Erwinia sp. 9145]
MNRACLLITAVIVLSGCALKRYPDSPPVTDVQATIWDCDNVTERIAAQQRVQSKIDKTGEFDSLTVLGFLGDFGIGNGVVKNRAQKAADRRMARLKTLQTVKCPPGR